MTELQKQLAVRIKRWRHNPKAFFIENGITDKLDPWQEEACQALADWVNGVPGALDRLAIAACAGPGKTWWDSGIIWWFMVCFGDDKAHPQGFATGISGPNLKANLWTKLAEMWQTTPLLKFFFEWQAEKIFLKEHPATWWFEKRTWTASAEAGPQGAGGLAGHHSKYSLAVVDESGGVPISVMRAATRTLTTKQPGGFNFLIQTGNPTHVEGPLFEAFNNEAALWHRINISGDPDNPKCSSRIDKVENRRLIDLYGREDPYVKVYVLGLFPPSSFNSLLGPDDVRKAMSRTCSIGQYAFIQCRTGTDVAFGGGDLTVFYGRQGIKVYAPDSMRVDKSSETWSFDIAARLLTYKRKINAEVNFVDCTGGYGDGVCSALSVQKHTAIRVNSASAANKPQTFANRRMEMWWNMAEAIKRDACLPNDPEIIAELTTPTYSLTNTGLMILEPKDRIKLRLGRSPDRADALGLTYSTNDIAKTVARLRVQREGHGNNYRRQRSTRDYNPLDQKR
jgi:hypothetical protein